MNENKHKFWLVIAVSFAVLVVALLVLYPTVQKTLFGKAISLGEIAYYSFNDGTARDLSGNGNDGILRGLITPSSDGIDGGSFQFNDDNDFIFLPDSPLWDTGGEVTVSAWFKTNVATNEKGIVNAVGPWMIYFTGGTTNDWLRFYLRTPSSPTNQFASCVLPEGSLTNNQWHHAVGTFDRSLSAARVKIYVDGALCASQLGLDEDIIPGTPGEGILIGGVARNPFFGLIDDVRIYNRALSSSEIDTLYTSFARPIVPTQVTRLNMQFDSVENVYVGSDAAVNLILYYVPPTTVGAGDGQADICKENSAGRFPASIDCRKTSTTTAVERPVKGYQVVLPDNTCYLIDDTSFPTINVHVCETFNLLVECLPIIVNVNEVVKCSIILDRPVDADFGAQFVINAPGLRGSGTGVGGIDFTLVATLQGSSAGLGGQSIFARVTAGSQNAGPVATFNLVANTPGVTEVGLTDLIVVSGTRSASLRVVFPDRDGDGIVDSVDLCPTVVGTVEARGCPQFCGNNLIEGTEECDGTNLASQTCASQGGPPAGTISCSSACRFDLTGCGNIVRPEVCDNNLDDDTDGTIDCADSDCIGNVACPTRIRGDVNGDGVVTTIDAVLILRHLVNVGMPLVAQQQAVADVNGCQAGQTGITTVDAVLVLRRVVGLIQNFPC